MRCSSFRSNRAWPSISCDRNSSAISWHPVKPKPSTEKQTCPGRSPCSHSLGLWLVQKASYKSNQSPSTLYSAGCLRSTAHLPVWPMPNQKHTQQKHQAPLTPLSFQEESQQISPCYWITELQGRILTSPCSDAMNSYTSSTLQRLGLVDRKTGLMPCRSGVGGAILEFDRSLSP